MFNAYPEVRRYGKTSITFIQPNGYTHKDGTRLLCADGKIRAVAHIGSFADTYFSIRAAVRVKGRYVTGYATVHEDAQGNRAYVFRKHTGEDALPQWPDFYTAPFETLMAKAREETVEAI